MVHRRTRARLRLGIAVLTLVVQVCSRRKLRRSDATTDAPELSLPALALGALRGTGGGWLYDHDVGRIRTDVRRRTMVAVCTLGVRRRLLPRTERFRYSFGIGQNVGTALYRGWYGLLRPLPGDE